MGFKEMKLFNKWLQFSVALLCGGWVKGCVYGKEGGEVG